MATMMVPGEILTIPNFVTLAHLGWINTYKAMVAPWATSVFSIFLLRQQFASIPQSYYKAARMDGCSDLRYLFTVMVPMSRPTMVSIALLKIINSWNSYMWPLISTNSHPACGPCLLFHRGRHGLQYPHGLLPDDHCPDGDRISADPEIHHSGRQQNRPERLIFRNPSKSIE